MDTSSSRASTAVGGARRTTDSAAFSAVSDTLGVDPLADLELAWLVQDFLDAPLPGSWRRLVTPAGQTQYVHIGLNRATPVHPALKRYKALVAYCKVRGVKEGVQSADLVRLDVLFLSACYPY